MSEAFSRNDLGGLAKAGIPVLVHAESFELDLTVAGSERDLRYGVENKPHPAEPAGATLSSGQLAPREAHLIYSVTSQGEACSAPPEGLVVDADLAAIGRPRIDAHAVYGYGQAVIRDSFADHSGSESYPPTPWTLGRVVFIDRRLGIIYVVERDLVGRIRAPYFTRVSGDTLYVYLVSGGDVREFEYI